MKKPSRKERRSNVQTRPDYSRILYESTTSEDRDYWLRRIISEPLYRYTTTHRASDVVTLIKTIDKGGESDSPNVHFDQTPTPLEEEGLRYYFQIDYGDFGINREPLSRKTTAKGGHIEGVVISGATETIIEFRSTGDLMIVDFGYWFFRVFCPIVVLSLYLALFLEIFLDNSAFELVVVFGVTIIALITTFWTFCYRDYNAIVQADMKTVIKKLESKDFSQNDFSTQLKKIVQYFSDKLW